MSVARERSMCELVERGLSGITASIAMLGISVGKDGPPRYLYRIYKPLSIIPIRSVSVAKERTLEYLCW